MGGGVTVGLQGCLRQRFPCWGGRVGPVQGPVPGQGPSPGRSTQVVRDAGVGQAARRREVPRGREGPGRRQGPRLPERARQRQVPVERVPAETQVWARPGDGVLVLRESRVTEVIEYAVGPGLGLPSVRSTETECVCVVPPRRRDVGPGGVDDVSVVLASLAHWPPRPGPDDPHRLVSPPALPGPRLEDRNGEREGNRGDILHPHPVETGFSVWGPLCRGYRTRLCESGSWFSLARTRRSS